MAVVTAGPDSSSGDVDAHCAQDEDCVVVAPAACCECPSGLQAVNAGAWQARMNECAAVECSVSVSCGSTAGGEVGATPRAVCRAGLCVLAPS